jgi:proteasome lid subunit RPN8/RPN11
METTILDVGGDSIDAASLTIPRARDLAGALSNRILDFVRLVDCRHRAQSASGTEDEIIVVDLDIQRPQIVENDIRFVERIAIVFQIDDETYPEVLALRGDFPLVPHRNLRAEEFPRSLCLYDQSWDEVRTRWTAAALIERIRSWLADTATGTLHRGDQPLEPLLFGTRYRLVIPADVVKVDGEKAEKLDVSMVPSGERRGTLIAAKPQAPPQKGQVPQFIASMFFGEARQHGVIRHAPRSLEELADFVKGEHFDLLAELRRRVVVWKDDGCLETAVIIVMAFPLQRQAGLEPEISDVWAFLTTKSVFDIGKAIGVWDKASSGRQSSVGLIIPADASRKGTDVGLDVLRPHFSFSRASAARANGTEPVTCKVVAVGTGALGSQVVMNLVRGGFGIWTVIDDDEFMPHNLARHSLPPWWAGMAKAPAVAGLIDAYYEEATPTRGIVANVLRAGEQKQAVDAAFGEAELILDLAASVPVARHLAQQIDSSARRASLFLNPRGSDLVCLSEDRTRSITLDCVEMQYCRALIRDERLAGHLEANSQRMRYARSCRDVSFALPTHLISIHAGIGSQAVRNVVTSADARIKVWRTEAVDCGTVVVDVPVYRVHRAGVGDWTLVMDDWLFQTLSELRTAKLPNETGGILLGTYDLPRKTLYVVDTIPSPPDSEEWPTLYIRGSVGLREKVSNIAEMTANQLEYVGEWHSHPDGCSCMPSEDDIKVFTWMTDRMSAAGLPALMTIVGAGRSSMWFLGKMESGGWEPVPE